MEACICKRAQAAFFSPCSPCRAPTAPALWALPPGSLSTSWPTPARSSGRSSPWSPPAAATPLTCPPPASRATPCCWTRRPWPTRACSPTRSSPPPDGPTRTGWTTPGCTKTEPPCSARPGSGAGSGMPRLWTSFWPRNRTGCPTTPCSWPCGSASAGRSWQNGPTRSACGGRRPWKRPGGSWRTRAGTTPSFSCSSSASGRR